MSAPAPAPPAVAVADRLEQLFAIDRAAGANRPGLSAAEERAVALAEGWMRAAGLTVARDPAGNLVGRLPGSDPALPEVWTGSHLDTVPDGGRYDGALGVVAAIEALARIAARPSPRRRTLAAVAFRLEEGWRFGRGVFGSRALCGALEPDERALRDAGGVTLGDALAALGLDPPDGGWLAGGPGVFVELHVEQGPVLADRALPVGVVTGIAGMAGLAIRLTGRAGHAGTTPIDARSDAVVAASRLVLALRAAAADVPGAVATVGTLHVEPGATNVVPAAVELFADLRAPDRPRLDRLLAAARRAAGAAAAAERCAVDVAERWRLDPVAMADGPTAALRRAVAAAGVEPLPLASGAGHDAGVLAGAGVDAAMLFVRSNAGGVSHAPGEATDAAAIATGIDVLEAALRELAA